MSTEKPNPDICICGHDKSQHTKSGPRQGTCLASDRLGYSICRCTKFLPEGSDPSLAFMEEK